MQLLKKMLKEKAIYWAPDGLDDDSQPTYAAPIEIKCRWEEVSEIYLNDNGEEVVSKSKVYVDRELQKKGRLKYGDMNSLASVDPFASANGETFEIQSVSRIPTLNAKKALRWVFL